MFVSLAYTTAHLEIRGITVVTKCTGMSCCFKDSAKVRQDRSFMFGNFGRLG